MMKVMPEVQQAKTDITGLVEAKEIIQSKIELVKSDRILAENEGWLTKQARTSEKVKLMEELLSEIQSKIDMKLDKILEFSGKEKELVKS